MILKRRAFPGLILFVGLAQPAIGQTKAERLDSLTTILAGLDRAGTFHGVVLVADQGQIVHHSAHGLAHKGYGVANRPDTKFNLASVGKTFTAVAVGQLIEQGKLRLTDTLARVLPDYPNQAVARRITIGQLLTHRSGLGLYWDKLFDGNWTAVRTTADLTPFFAKDTLDFAPGTQWFYSNTGYAVLALVIEKVSGLDYFDYIQQKVLTPAGMTSTGFFPLDIDVPNLAVGYYRDEKGVLKNNLFTHTVRGGGAGGGWSTAEDLVKWAQALMEGRVLKPATATMMTTKQTDTERPGPGGYGYGFIIQQRNDRTIVGHTGGFPGIATFWFFDPAQNRVGVMMTNEPNDAVRPVWSQVEAYLTARH